MVTKTSLFVVLLQIGFSVGFPVHEDKDDYPGNNKGIAISPMMLPWQHSTVPVYISPELRGSPNPSIVYSPQYRGIVQDMFTSLSSLYSDFVKRREALLELIYCRRCDHSYTDWQTFLDSLSKIPAISWAVQPNKPAESKTTFVVGVNDNGVWTGVGGSYVNKVPYVEYSFNTTHIVHNKPYQVKSEEGLSEDGPLIPIEEELALENEEE